MTTRVGSVLPPIKIPGTIEDRAVLSALESLEAAFDALAALPSDLVQTIPFPYDVKTLAEITVYCAPRAVELTAATFETNGAVTAAVQFVLSVRGNLGQGATQLGTLTGGTWTAFSPVSLILSGSRKIDAGKRLTLSIAPNGFGATFAGSLNLTFRAVT